MPYRPLRPCTKPGCSNLVVEGRCEAHKRVKDYRKSAYKRGYDSYWQRLRKSYLLSHPLCEQCLKDGCYTTATEVHHKESVREHPETRLDVDVLEALCKSCHSRITIMQLNQ